MWHKGVRWHHVESNILKKVQGQKHPGRWGIVEHQIPSIKILFDLCDLPIWAIYGLVCWLECMSLKLWDGFSPFGVLWNCPYCSCVMPWAFAHLTHIGLSNGQSAYLWICLMDLLCSKFYGIYSTCSCAASWLFAHLPHMNLPMSQKLAKFHATGVQTLWNPYL